MAKRKTIGENPLDSLLQLAQKSGQTNGQTNVADFEERVERKVTSAGKQRITVHISADVIERIKNAVYFTPGLTLAAFAEQAFSKAVDRLEKEKPFPQRHGELKTGRPIK